ncbi:MAG TPA: acetoacetate--CoA ligase, partial [Burkholderiales bacterium]|nr:acetoacetate--CoA ligase [Burkholderiales bacterium]
MDQALWTPSLERVATSQLSAFTRFINERYGIEAKDYAELHAWSCDNREQFWQAIWHFCGVIGTLPDDTVLI